MIAPVAYVRALALSLSLSLAGCLGASGPPPEDDGGFRPAPDMAPLCIGNNDGVIARSELSFPIGAEVRYLQNPAGTQVTVNPAGTPGPSGLEWDLTSTAGEVVAFAVEPVEGQWFAASFPSATYATLTDVATQTLGVFRVTERELQILGFASRAEGKTLLVYDAPVASLRFPLREGDAWVAVGKVTNGKLEGVAFASQDTYRIRVAARGTAVLPYLRLDNTLRIEVQLTQSIPGGLAVNRVQQLFMHECFGEIGRMASPTGETNPGFTDAAEFRRVAL